MQILPLSINEQASSGFTHKIVITFTDFLPETSGAACGIFPKLSDEATKLGPIGMRVRACALRAVSLFVAPSMTDLSVTIGDGGSANRFLTSSEIGGTTTPITAGTWYETFAAAPFIYTAADSIDIVPTATGAALSALTAGECHVYLAVTDMVAIDTGINPSI